MARPTSLERLARPEITTAPSMPVNAHTVVVVVAMTCLPKLIPPSLPEKFCIKVSKARAKIMTTISTRMGIIFAMVETRLTAVDSFVPRSTRIMAIHHTTDMPMTDGMLFPTPNRGRNCPTEANRSVKNEMFESSSLNQ